MSAFKAILALLVSMAAVYLLFDDVDVVQQSRNAFYAVIGVVVHWVAARGDA